ncbi:hypothetical protein GGR54DRAFT_344 [Hypoxylon sp. NC1633]|nr:hypothetical protein GGR54DRAFT_344 [Hypoxylon sp. NC1633]
MDRKIPLDAPPPYTADPTTSAAFDEFQLSSLTSQLQHHVTSLPDRIRATQQARRAEQTLSDASLLDHIVPIVEQFLADLGARHGTVPLATLTLVPATAVPKNAVLSGLDDMRRRGELCRISRVSIHSESKDSKSGARDSSLQTGAGDQSWASGQEFSDWGRFDETDSQAGDATGRSEMLWWRDEDMAHRLASYLQPKKEKTRVEHKSVVQDVVEQRIPPTKEKRGWGWGRRTSEQRSPEAQIVRPPNIDFEIFQEEPQRKGADMTVTAQEVAFRVENGFGIWESVRGWGIVVAVDVKA